MREKKRRVVNEEHQKSTVRTTKVFSIIDEAYKTGYRTVSLQGSARSGKTYNTMIWLCAHAYNTPDTTIAVIRSTMPRLKRTVYQDFKNVMRNDLQIWEPDRMNETLMEYEFDNGSRMVFFATEDSGAAQGLKSTIAFLNEATEIEYNVYRQISIRAEKFVILDYNPNFGDDHWISKMNRDPKGKGVLMFSKTTYKDNPYLPIEQIKEIESLKDTDERLWRIYGLGEQSMVEGLIFDNYTVVDDIPERLERKAYIGVDWGYKDPFAVTKVAIDQSARTVYLKELCYKSMMSIAEQTEVLLSPECVGHTVICDNAAPQLKDEMKKAGIRIKATKKITSASRSSIIPGISVMQSYHICITKDSINGLVEAQNYTWKRDRNGEWLNEPIDKFNHFWDSARYVVYTVGVGFKGGGQGRGIIIH